MNMEQGLAQQREVWRHVTMVALFLCDNKTNDDGDGKENGKKYMFILTNNNFALASHYFVHFFAAIAPIRYETSSFHEPALWSRWTTHKNCRLLFLNLYNDRYGPKENFAKIWQIKWNWIRSVKFEIVRLDF